MKNNYNFAVKTIIDDSLYVVIYNGTEVNEFDYLFNNWHDVEYLFNFFEKHKADLQRNIYNNISVEDAVLQTLKDADNLENILIKTAENGKKKCKTKFANLV